MFFLVFLMKCINPYRLKNPKFPEESKYEYINCGCGKCFPCLVNRRSLWWFRLYQEHLNSVSSFFVTLTYDDEHCDGFLHREHLRDFFKRLRHVYDFKYYAIGEYGTNTLRPHYHFIAFLKSPVKESDFLAMCQFKWNFGFSSIGSVNGASINYVLHYHVRPKKPVKGLKTFQCFSKGLGISFLFDTFKSSKHEPSVLTLRNSSVLSMLENSPMRLVSDGLGHTFVIPRYYIKKLKEQGVTIYEPDYNDCIPYQDLLREMLPDIQFLSDGRCANYPDEFVLSLLNDVQYNSKKKLKRYDYQQKNSL